MKVKHLIEALTIIMSTQPETTTDVHDGAIFVGEYRPKDLTPAQRRRLRALGWAEREDSWAREM